TAYSPQRGRRSEVDVVRCAGFRRLGLTPAADGRIRPVRGVGRRRALKHLSLLFRCLGLCPLSALLQAAPQAVTFVQSAQTVDAYDFVEITLQVARPDAANPFTDVSVTGSFGKRSAGRLPVDGFCDSPDGSVFHIRFMPVSAGDYTYSVSF